MRAITSGGTKTKISRDKIVRAAVGSARLERYKGTVKPAITKKAAASRAEADSKATAER